MSTLVMLYAATIWPATSVAILVAAAPYSGWSEQTTPAALAPERAATTDRGQRADAGSRRSFSAKGFVTPFRPLAYKMFHGGLALGAPSSFACWMKKTKPAASV